MATKAKVSGSIPFEFQPIAAFDVGTIIDANERGMAAAIEVNSHLIDRMSKVTHEVIEFVEKRLNEDASFAKKLMACDSPPEAFAVYGSFLQTAVEQYGDEFSRIATLYSDITAETLEETRQEVEETLEALEPADFEESTS